MFTKDVHHYHVVELEKDIKLPELSGELRESLKTLLNQPAFQYILLRFRVKKAAMQATLNEGFNLEEKQLRYCQSGIYWAGEIERDIKALTATDTTPTRKPQPTEKEEFERILRSVQLVGQD